MRAASSFVKAPGPCLSATRTEFRSRRATECKNSFKPFSLPFSCIFRKTVHSPMCFMAVGDGMIDLGYDGKRYTINNGSIL